MSVRRFFSVAIVVAVGCGTASHVYEGRAYIESRDCLGTTSSVDVVEGEKPTQICAPICLSQGHSDGGRSLYVSTMCAPYPFQFDASATDPGCAHALAAFGRDDTCNANGTSTHPQDAGVD